jgi:hypothetical protein
MAGFARLIFLGLFALTLIYWLVRVYARSLRREALEKDWDAARGQGLGARDDYVSAGLAEYEKSLRRKLLWFVYILPITVLIVLIFFVNAQ